MSVDDFQAHFLAICTAHRAQGRALAFAFILLDKRHPHFRRAVEEETFWDALDEMSGRTLSVFSFDVRVPAPRRQSSVRNTVQWITSVDSSGHGHSIDILSSYFEGLSLAKLPCVLFFQVNEGAVVDSLAASLDTSATTSDAAYEELAGVIRTAVESLANVDDENAGNSREIFQLILGGLHQRALKRRVVTVYRAVKGTASLVGIGRLIGAIV